VPHAIHCRYAGLIKDDDRKTIDPRYHQVEVRTWLEYGTLVEIEYPNQTT
jgi:hypothetical protein